MTDPIQEWAARIRNAAADGSAVCLRGGGTKDFLGRTPMGEVLDTRGYTGIVSYEPSELVVTARAGTPLVELEAALAEAGQMLAFEPPRFAPGGTVGGCVAAGLAGPRRAAVGGVRDFVLGVRLLDGRGDDLRFGGQVMKNVAGYDVARVMAGSLGTLGLLLEVSLKVLPRPPAEATLAFALDEPAALERVNAWSGQPLPVSATAWRAGRLHVRLSGAAAAVEAAIRRLGGEVLADTAAHGLWAALRDHTDDFFTDDRPLWRLSVPSDAPPLDVPGETLVEWGGAQRWLKGEQSAAELRARVAAVGGHATLFRHGDRAGEVFHPLLPAMAALQRRLKQTFDPAGVFGPGRLYGGM